MTEDSLSQLNEFEYGSTQEYNRLQEDLPQTHDDHMAGQSNGRGLGNAYGTAAINAPISIPIGNLPRYRHVSLSSLWCGEEPKQACNVRAKRPSSLASLLTLPLSHLSAG